MGIKDNRLLKLVAAGAAAMMILGLAAVVTSAQRGPGNRTQLQEPGASGGGFGRGMMGGPGMMGGQGRGGRGGPGGPGGPMGILGPGARALQLTDAQREQIRAIMENHKPEFEAIGQPLAEARKTLRDSITADTPDETLIRQHAAAVAALEADQAVLEAKVHAEVFSLLTAEQQQKLKTAKQEAETRMQDRRNRMMRERIKQVQDTMPIGDPGLV